MSPVHLSTRLLPCWDPTAILTTLITSPKLTRCAMTSGGHYRNRRTIGVCMDVGKIPWEDTKAAKALVQEMIDGTGSAS